MFKCIVCGFRDTKPGKCPRCGIPLLYDANYEKFRPRELPGVWRYIDVLPRPRRMVSLGEGFTRIRRLDSVFVKYEGSNPTGSYYDRGSAVLAGMMDPGIKVNLVFEEDLTRSLALYLASIGIKPTVSVGLNVNVRDLLMLTRLGIDVCIGCVSESTINYFDPFLIEGFKTISYEIYEQLGVVNEVVVPVERGALIISVLKGFMELRDHGIIDDIPKITGSYVGKIGGPVIDRLRDMGLRFVRVNETDVIGSMIELSKKSIYPTLISATAYAVAKNSSNAVAVVSGSFRYKVTVGNRAGLRSLQRLILERVPREKPLTAYSIWKMTGGSLLGIYKALNSLADKGMVKVVDKVVGKRKIKYYVVIGRHGDDF